MCYMPAKILTPAYGGNDHYMDFFSADNDTVKSWNSIFNSKQYPFPIKTA